MGNIDLVAAKCSYPIQVTPNIRSAFGELHLRCRGGWLPQPRRMWRKQSGWVADGCVCGFKLWLFLEMKMHLAGVRCRLRLLLQAETCGMLEKSKADRSSTLSIGHRLKSVGGNCLG
jgi:hypothetical protein